MFKQQKLSAFLFLIALAQSFIFTQSVQAGSIFNRDLQVGNVNFDVQALQKFLNTHGFALAKYGSGSLGRETTYFGTATKNALTKFQQANQIVPATGYLNLTTRNLVNKMLASVVINHSLTGGTVINTKTNSQAPTPIATSTSNQLHSYYSIGGSVYGIDGAITIKNNGGDNVIVTPRDNSEFIFSTKLAAGAN
jgi:peptidoglycan hydrolase-like protein with peptidoglycan-binding domain